MVSSYFTPYQPSMSSGTWRKHQLHEHTVNYNIDYSFLWLFLLPFFRDFSNGHVGLAWPGVVCKESDFKTSFNTGLVSFINYGHNQTLTMVSENLAHEVLTILVITRKYLFSDSIFRLATTLEQYMMRTQKAVIICLAILWASLALVFSHRQS